MKNKHTFVDKPLWGINGKEEWIVNNDLYCGKILYIPKNANTSLQYHKEKHETLWVKKGKARILCGENIDELQEIVLEEGESITFQPFFIHQTFALEELEIVEFSTPHKDEDVYRIKQRDL